MKAAFVIFVILCQLFSVAQSLSCMPCKKTKCGPKPSCKGGYTKDVCGCCDVCAKLEGQLCGGYWFHFGRCDANLKCVLRSHGKSKVLKGYSIKPGRCEPDKCAAHNCGLHQSCSVVDGSATCECPRLCKDKEKPLCGLDNGIEYLNMCYLRRYECKTGQRIPYVRGPCRYCAYKGQIYKFEEKIQQKDKCQICSCAHGRWRCTADTSCKKVMPSRSGKSIPCSVPGLRGRDSCPRGLMCAYVNTTTGQSGFCVPRSGSKAQTSEQTGRECPMRKCKPCKRGYQVDKRGCKTCNCIQVNVCELPKYSGPCRALFQRYYFNKKSGKCSRFIYGGCRGNGNNFRTKFECKLKCHMRKAYTNS